MKDVDALVTNLLAFLTLGSHSALSLDLAQCQLQVNKQAGCRFIGISEILDTVLEFYSIPFFAKDGEICPQYSSVRLIRAMHNVGSTSLPLDVNPFVMKANKLFGLLVVACTCMLSVLCMKIPSSSEHQPLSISLHIWLSAFVFSSHHHLSTDFTFVHMIVHLSRPFTQLAYTT